MHALLLYFLLLLSFSSTNHSFRRNVACPRSSTRSRAVLWEDGGADAATLFSSELRWFRRSKGDTVTDTSTKIPSGRSDDDATAAGAAPKTFAEVRTLPLFPFDDGCAFPTGDCPLHLFMMPFWMMLNDVQQTDRMFGIVMSNGRGGLCEVGTAVENVHRELLPDGRQILDNVCRQRFRIVRMLQEEPYMVAEVEYGLVDDDVAEIEAGGTGELPDALVALEKEVFQCLSDVVNLTNLIGEHTSSNGGPTVRLSDAVVNLQPAKHLFRLTVASDFSFACADMIGASAHLRQLLLETNNLELRLRRIRSALKTARDFLMKEAEKIEQPFN
jgi:hypothetical protein